VEGSGNSLDRNFHYSVKMDIYFLAERVKSINVRFVNLFRRHDKLWVNRKVRNVILQIDCALMEHGTSHIGVIEMMSNVMEEYVTHGLHLSS
jgi:hypothetical protein